MTLLVHHCHTSSSIDNSPTSPPPSFSSSTQSLIPDFDLFQESHQPTPYSPYYPSAFDLSYRGPTEDYIIDSRQSTPYESNIDHLQLTPELHDPQDTQYMTHSFSTNPSLRVQQSTPSGGLRGERTPPPMSEGSNWVQSSWNGFDQTYLSPQATQQQHPAQQSFGSHKRLSSDSSIGSTGPDSPYTHSTVHPYIVDSDSQPNSSPVLEPYDASPQYAQHIQPFAKPLYYQQQSSAINPSFVSPTFQNLTLGGSNAVTGAVGSKQLRDYQTMINMNTGQRTTRRSFANNGTMGAPMGLATNIPKLDRTVSDVYQDELYDSSVPTSAQSQQTPLSISHASLLSPNRSVFNDRLRQANTARSESPSTDMARERSPFRDDSEFLEQSFSQAAAAPGNSRINTAAQMRQEQKSQADRQAYMQHHPNSARNGYAMAPTISPKEALLEYDEPAKIQSATHIKREPEFLSAHAGPNSFGRENTSNNGNDSMNCGALGTDYASLSSGRHPTSDLPSSQQPNSSSFTFMPPNLPSEASQRYPWTATARRQSSSMRSLQSDQAPEFPSTLTSMESTKSESGQEQNERPPGFSSETSSSQRSEAASPLPRPADTSASSGSYTCVAPGCSSRFNTSAKLQRHRKDNHRTTPQHATTPGSPSSSISAANPQAAANNVSRNNAPGPHKCERINPSTGKPCNTQFSRSYDLTRHEDTIHNNRKQKVRCHLCTEEKTFSRNDALTRHMRVVHPDVDFPGRNRRR